jgi:hypothetical protein
VTGESDKYDSVRPCTRTSNGLKFLLRASPFDSPHYLTKSFPSKSFSDKETRLQFISDTSYINTYRVPTPTTSPKSTNTSDNKTYRSPQISSVPPVPSYQSDRTDYETKHDQDETEASETGIINVNLATKKKYKPVALKVKPHIGTLPDKFRIIRNIIGNPLKELPILPIIPPTFTPTGRYTEERKEIFDKINAGFLLPSERDLLHYFMMIHNDGFAWETSERGHFREDFFPPIDIPVIPHKPWVQRNSRIPPGLYDEFCRLVKDKIDAGVFEPSNSSYRSRWFCVVKKDGKSLRIVQSLEPLNEVTIAHSGVPPFTEQLAEQFAGRACNSILDLYVGYDARAIAPSSRDLTTFQTPYGAMRLTTLPMGWTNSVPIFHDDVCFILQEEIPHVTIPYIDDVPVRGPASRYIQENGEPETIPGNPGIRRFVWEHFQDLNRIIQRMKYSGGTFSGYKTILCAEEITVLGHRCTINGRLPDQSRVEKIVNWGPCKDLTDVRAFVGTIGVCRLFIKNFAHRAHHLVKLTRKGAEWEFGPDQLAAMEDLKQALLTSPALRPINYKSDAPVILSVDTSYLAIGYILSQSDTENPKRRYHARFGSITLNERESRFSQPKLELYGLYRTLRALKLYLIGIRNLIIEVDAKYIKGMLSNPDIAPSASINRWIVSILMFHFTLVHVPGTHHGPDGLSRRRRQPGDREELEDDFEDWIDDVNGFLHLINSAPTSHNSITQSPLITAYITDSIEEAVIHPVETSQTSKNREETLTYADVPRSASSHKTDTTLQKVRHWLETLQRPADISDDQYKTFMRYCTEFFVAHDKLWRKNAKGQHKLVVPQDRRLFLMESAHNDVGHHGFYATHALLSERYWWPNMAQDINWFITTCHVCQTRKTQQVLIPPIVSMPAPLFSKVYMDTMHMPTSSGYKYIVQGRCSLIYWPEWAMLTKENAAALGKWILHDIIYRWGLLLEIVTDNGPAFLKALAWLEKHYHIKHIRISGYNSRANGLVERSHFEVREAIFKACDGNQSKWSNAAYSVFWAERVTIRRRLGCSPYFAATGTHPLLPIDIAEANYLLPPPTSTLNSTDLMIRRAITLQKRPEQLAKLQERVYLARVQAAQRFEKEHAKTIKDFDFKLGDLVLVRNTAIEKALNRKMRARYLGPVIVLARNKGGAYVLSELDGSVFHRPIAAFRVIPYFARRKIDLPPLDELLDISRQRLQELKDSTATDPDDEDTDNSEPLPDD